MKKKRRVKRRVRVTDLSRSMWRDPVPRDGERIVSDAPQVAFGNGFDQFGRVEA